MILLGFAAVVGVITSRQVNGNFNRQLTNAADGLTRRLTLQIDGCQPPLDSFARADNAAIRVIDISDTQVFCHTTRAPDFGIPANAISDVHGYRVYSQVRGLLAFDTPVIVQYARPLSSLHETTAKVRFVLALGVIGGAALALLGGLAVARRAMAPIARLTATAREIERTRDPGMRVPHPEAEDEVAELARTLEAMLGALDSARAETEGMLARQREFVADASHELRTPLTSVLANLELLADELDGEPREAAASALRSSRRMRRLVADLRLLARADAGRAAPHRPTDLGDVLVEVAAELEPVAAGHELAVDARPAVVDGARDELHRLALNLIENAIRHTPPGTRVNAEVAARNGEVVLRVEDDGPGIPRELRGRIFERFVRGGGNGRAGGGSGLGLSIVRSVAESHGGSVALEPGSGLDQTRGARFVVRFPAAGDRAHEARLGAERAVR